MEPDRLLVFRKLLQERLSSLETSFGARIGELVDQRDVLADTADIATEESDRDLTLRMHDHERKVVDEIRAAIRRIDDGEYGVCEACGDDIGERRLLARPMATHCIDCMTELEATQRREPSLL
ncbi:MAG: TraR/DksA C4-type zinc finger protein [Alphaproteobacteria bacterium]|nr:TraR/DksA C4-type zinc finger protein [Alphaproteobacteria bacterium]